MIRPRSDAQWKGTHLCLDFVCTCDHYQHIDGYFASPVICDACGLGWDLKVVAEEQQHD